MWSFECVISMMFFCKLVCLATKLSQLLMFLMFSELMLLNLIFFLAATTSPVDFSSIFFLFIFMVCEASVGLTLLVCVKKSYSFLSCSKSLNKWEG